MNIDEKVAELKTNIENCERVCEAIPTGSIRDAALRKAEDCRQMLEWLEDYKRLKAEKELKADILDKISAEVEEQKECRCFDDDDMPVYITGLNDAIYIINKYKAESGGEE